MDEDQQVVVWCEYCKAEVAHWRINAALRICTGCQNEIHEEERIMAKHFTEAEKAGVQLRLAGGATVKELAKEMGRSYYTIYSIKQAMPKGLKGKKLEAALRKAAEKQAVGAAPMGRKCKNFITVLRKEAEDREAAGQLPRGVDLAGVGAPAERYQAGSTLAAENIPAIVLKKWIVTIINCRLDEIRAKLISLVK